MEQGMVQEMVDEAGGDGDGTTIKKVLCGGFSKVSNGHWIGFQQAVP